MTTGQLIRGRMVWGAAALGVYGIWVAVARLPDGESLGLRLGSSAWAVVLFASVGATIAALTVLLALLASRPLPPRYRFSIAPAIETAVLVPLFGWLVLNEFVYATTSEVLGIDAISLAWYNTRAVFENAWAMGARYLLATAVLTLTAVAVVYALSFRSFRRFAVPTPAPSCTRLLRRSVEWLLCVLNPQLRQRRR